MSCHARVRDHRRHDHPRDRRELAAERTNRDTDCAPTAEDVQGNRGRAESRCRAAHHPASRTAASSPSTSSEDRTRGHRPKFPLRRHAAAPSGSSSATRCSSTETPCQQARQVLGQSRLRLLLLRFPRPRATDLAGARLRRHRDPCRTRPRRSRALIGMAASLAMIVFFIVPAINDGRPPLQVAAFGALGIMLLTIPLVHGGGAKSLAAVSRHSVGSARHPGPRRPVHRAVPSQRPQQGAGHLSASQRHMSRSRASCSPAW